MPKFKIDYDTLLKHIKKKSPYLITHLHQYMIAKYQMSEHGRYYAINRMIKMGYLARDKDSPRLIIHYIRK